ncbi:recombination regulator RecX [Vespertiliibacter pulmonis]|uniref:Regulatory protein RecX n=1 Tax=Vespertiliibacter pulmonis TaxID=1443036 RepID=A0A3N4VTE4_9PAST|nr:recombination regulator RecX [Vespertiliibacter pulmonis]QLB20405.1 recombination regulator RecX [Vespertiliibacter pulmonis]RPE86392.1 regulatory protein [Vespertiliibacter pulmonis]
MKTKSTAIQYLVYLLSRRDHSERELRQKLKQKEYTPQEIDQAIERAQQQNWQSDERFCQHFIRYRSQQGYGPNRLKQELRFKGVSERIISQELENSEIDWFDLAECLFEKKRPADWNLKTKQKMWRYMISHGFYSDHFSHLMDIDYAEYE